MIFISPSYIRDLERFLQLRESIRRFCKTPAKHLVVVPRQDHTAFLKATRGDEAVEVLVQQDVVAALFYPMFWYPWVKALLKERSWRLSRFGGRSGWIIQQIVKMNYPSYCDAPYALMMDSDCLFFRDFDESDFIGLGDKKILLKQYPSTESAMHRLYINGARDILKLPTGPSHFHYMAFPAIFYGNYLEKLQNHLEQIHSKPWQRVLFDAGTISEYSIYGIFVEEILQPDDILLRETPFNLGIWTEDCLAHSDSIMKKVEQICQESEDTEKPFCLTVQSNMTSSTDAFRVKFIDKFIKPR